LTIKTSPVFPPKKRELVELCKFVLNRKTDQIRDELCSFLIAYSLYVKPKMGISEIASHIEKTYALPDFPEDRIAEAVSTLKEKRELAEENQQYSLTESKIKELQGMTNSLEETREYVQNKLISNIRKRYQTISKSQINSIIEALYKLLGTIFARYGIVCAEAVTGNLARTMSDIPDFSSLCNDLFRSFENHALRRIVMEEMRGIFEKPDGRTSNFFLCDGSKLCAYGNSELGPRMHKIK